MTVQESRQDLVRVGVVVVAALALASFSVPAYAWDFEESSGRIAVTRGVFDTTGTVTVSVADEYKGGESAVQQYPVGAVDSYDRSTYVGTLTPECAGMIVDLLPVTGPQLVVISEGGTPLVTYSGMPVVVPVSIEATTPVYVGGVSPSVITSVSADPFPIDVLEAVTFGVPLLVLGLGVLVGVKVRRT